MEHVADIVGICDREARILYLNHAFERITGFERDAFVGHAYARLISDDAHGQDFVDDLHKTVLSGEIWTGRLACRTKNTERITLEAQISPILDSEGAVTGFVAIKRDTTEREAMNKELMENERLSTMGQLIAGIAHEINHPLSLILADIEFMREHIARGQGDEPGSAGAVSAKESGKGLAGSLGEIEQAAERIRSVVGDLGAFSRADDDAVEVVDVCEVMDATLNLLGNEIKHRAQLVRKYGEVPRTMTQRFRLGQVFLNLVLNALQAIPVGAAGRHQLRVTTRATRSGTIRVEISDTGKGIPPELLPRLFDPFFSTRVLGHDVGLRLAVSHGIVNGLNGDLVVHSIPGHGTSYVVSLPIEASQEGRQADHDSNQAPKGSHGRRVLVIDDEASVLKIIRRMLRGYEVTTSLGGRDALEHLLNGEFDLVLCDVMMPEYTGVDLYERMAKDRPEMSKRFMFVTGGAFTEQTERFLRDVPAEVLGKPFTTTQLRAAVGKHLGE